MPPQSWDSEGYASNARFVTDLGAPVLELLAALWLLREPTAQWLFGLAGASSILLGMVLMLLPRAGTEAIVRLVGLYAVTFGVLTVLAAFWLRRAGGHASIEIRWPQAA